MAIIHHAEESKTMRTLRAFDSKSSMKTRSDSIRWNDIYTEVASSKQKLRRYRSRLMVHPENPLKLFFDMVVMACIVLIAILLPVEIAFDLDTNFVLEILLNVIFSIDLILGFNTGFWSKGSLILSRKLASIHYLRTWFSLDILSLLPYDLMANWFIRGDVETYANTFKTVKVWRLSKTLRALRALRLIRLVRVAKMPRLCKSINCTNSNTGSTCINPALLLLLRNFVLLLFLCHILGCSYYLIGIIEYPNSWIARRGLYQNSKRDDYTERYMNSVYWAFTTVSTVGYGDVSASTPVEMGFAMLAMGIGVVWTGLTVASVTQSFSELNMKAQLVNKKQKQVSRFIRSAKLPQDVHQEVEGFFRGGKDTDRLLQFEMKQQLLCQMNRELLNEMPQKLRSKVIICLRESLLSRLPFLNGADRGFVMNFLLHAKLKSVAPGSSICTEGTPSNGLIVVIEGHVAAEHGNKFVAVAGLGEIFGLVETFNNLCYTLTLKPRVDSAVLLLDSDHLKSLFTSYPDVANDLLQASEKLLGRIIPQNETNTTLVRRNSKTFIKEFEPGSTIIKQGDLGGEAYRILNGEVRVDVQMANNFIKTVATLKVGMTFGEIAQNAVNRLRTATCIAKDNVVLEVISVKKYEHLNIGLEGLEIDEIVLTESDEETEEEEEDVNSGCSDGNVSRIGCKEEKKEFLVHKFQEKSKLDLQKKLLGVQEELRLQRILLVDILATINSLKNK